MQIAKSLKTTTIPNHFETYGNPRNPEHTTIQYIEIRDSQTLPSASGKQIEELKNTAHLRNIYVSKEKLNLS